MAKKHMIKKKGPGYTKPVKVWRMSDLGAQHIHWMWTGNGYHCDYCDHQEKEESERKGKVWESLLLSA